MFLCKGTMEQNLNHVYTPSGDSPLCIAIRKKFYDAAFQFAKNKFGINVSDKDRDFPLHLAVKEDLFDLAESLLSNGANPDVTDKMSMTPLHLAFLYNHIPFVGLLLRYGANPENSSMYDAQGVTSPLRLAVDANNEEGVKLLLEAGAVPDKFDNFGKSVLLRALALPEKNERITRMMVQYSKDISLKCPKSMSYLSWAVHMGRCSIVQEILKKIASTNVNSQRDSVSLLIAVQKNCKQCFHNLVSFLGHQRVHRSENGNPLPLEVALNSSWRFDSNTNKWTYGGRLSPVLSGERLELAEILIGEYGVDIVHPFFTTVLIDSWHMRNGIMTASCRKALTLCICAYGDHRLQHAPKDMDYNKSKKLFENLGKGQEYELMMKWYEAGFKLNTGSILAIHHYHGGGSPTLGIVDDLNMIIKNPRSLKNLALIEIRAAIPDNVIYKSKFLGAPKVLQTQITLGYELYSP